MELSRERAVMDREPISPEPLEAVDKTALLTALTVLGVGMSFLLAMMFLLFPEWIRPRGFATEASPSPRQIFTLRAPTALEAVPVAVASSQPIQRPEASSSVRSRPERTRPVVAHDPTRNILAGELTVAPRLPESSPVGIIQEPVRGVASAANQILSGTIVSIGNGSITMKVGNGLVVAKVGDGTAILVNGQPRSLNDLAVGEQVTLIGATVGGIADSKGGSSGPAGPAGSGAPGAPSTDRAPGPIEPILKDPLKLPGF